jgi:hypothetical protein
LIVTPDIDNPLVTVAFSKLGFGPSYEVEVDPEFPPSGNWGVSVIRFGSGSAETLVIRVKPTVAEPWVGLFSIESRGLLVGLYACPNPAQLLVVTGMEAFLVLVNQPQDQKPLPIHALASADRPNGTDLIVVGSFTHLAAIDAIGLLWVTDRLFTDELKVTVGPPGKVYVQGWCHSILSDLEVLTIDPVTGRVIAGKWDPSLTTNEPKKRWHRDGL